MVPAQRPHRTRRNHRRSRTTRNQRRNRNHRLPRSLLGTIAYWFTSNGTRIHKTVHHYLFAATGGELSIDNDPDHEAIDVAWVPLEELPTRLSFANEQHIARSAREYITTQL